MQNFDVASLLGSSASLIGYGVSNKALLSYLLKKGICPVVRNPTPLDLPNGTLGIFGKDYLNASEDVIFRSPSVRPDKFPARSHIFTEAGYTLEISCAHKIGITGSDGKSTTSTLIHKMLSGAGLGAYLGGNIGTPLINYLDVAGKNDYLVCELSSFQLYDYEPPLDVSVITSISENHLDWHTSLGEYIFSKRNILKRAKRAVVNYDCEYRGFFTHSNTTYYSLSDCHDKLNAGESYVYLRNGYVYYNEKKLFPKDIIKIKGKYNLLNMLGAIGAVFPIVPLEKIIEVAVSFSGLSHRAEEIYTLKGIKFIDSSADSTPARTLATLSAFPRARVALIMGGYDKNLSYDILRDGVSGAKCVILYGANKEKIKNSINGAVKIEYANDISEAVALAYKMAQSGDYVILSPASASFDMFKDYRDRAEKYKDAIRGLENGENKVDFK